MSANACGVILKGRVLDLEIDVESRFCRGKCPWASFRLSSVERDGDPVLEIVGSES
jgi:hypothetical protein